MGVKIGGLCEGGSSLIGTEIFSAVVLVHGLHTHSASTQKSKFRTWCNGGEFTSDPPSSGHTIFHLATAENVLEFCSFFTIS